ncbi:MAG: hypothetical protein JXR46_07840 [Calditrichaceae bacterium]|nr:hypothetical protein [Calditrichaceae bacterium]MBN2708939.1 hypothetical protein [Calditrichaceae bacterium]RQV97538.1 MAG: hypothetical protein EH224_00520 [Calditrichota bacterium]
MVLIIVYSFCYFVCFYIYLRSLNSFDDKSSKIKKILAATDQRKKINSILFAWNSVIRLVIIISAVQVFLHQIITINLFALVVFVTVFTGLYVIIGGMNTVIASQAVQGFIIVLTIATGLFLSVFLDSGNYGIYINEVFSAGQFDILFHKVLYFVTLVLFLLIISIWNLAADLSMVQKVISGRNSGKSGYLNSSLLAVILLLIYIVTMIIAYYNTGFNMQVLEKILILNNGILGLITILCMSLMMIVIADALIGSGTLFISHLNRMQVEFHSENRAILSGRLIMLLLVVITMTLAPFYLLLYKNGLVYIAMLVLYIGWPALISTLMIKQQKFQLLIVGVGTILVIIRIALEIVAGYQNEFARYIYLVNLFDVLFPSLVVIITSLLIHKTREYKTASKILIGHQPADGIKA